MATPCSVKTRTFFACFMVSEHVTICDMFRISIRVNSNMKSSGKRRMLRVTAWFKALVSTPYNARGHSERISSAERRKHRQPLIVQLHQFPTETVAIKDVKFKSTEIVGHDASSNPRAVPCQLFLTMKHIKLHETFPPVTGRYSSAFFRDFRGQNLCAFV